MKLRSLSSLVLILVLPSFTWANPAPRQISGIYPHLAMFNDEGECGTGAVVPWAGRLWVVTYAPHMPKGSSDKLYEISPALEQKIRPESIGGTPANRLIHEESQQLFIGPHAISREGHVRTIPYTQMFGRPTGLARHLEDAAGKVMLATMEEGIYEIDVKTLAVKELWADEAMKSGGKHADLPGYHGKGFYASQGRYVYANNGDHAPEARSNPTVPSGVLAEWDGKAAAWTVVRRNQFTEVTGPGGIHGSASEAPLWAVGWDFRSLLLMMLHEGKWQAFRLPKGSHSYDGAHGWNTEWPRIREIGRGDELLMTMHGTFWKFPKTFTSGNTAGIAPRSNYLKVIGDFCSWQGKLVFGCDDAAKSEFLNKHPLKGDVAGPGKSHSNLWFADYGQLDALGPLIGRGSVWVKDAVKANVPSDAYLLNGYTHRSLVVSNHGSTGMEVALEVDPKGTGQWQPSRRLTLPAASSRWVDLTETGTWLRLVPQNDAASVTATFHYRNADNRSPQPSAVFAGVGENVASTPVMLVRGEQFRSLRCVQDGAAYDLDANLELKLANDSHGAAWTAEKAKIPPTKLQEDACSGYYEDKAGKRWRLPTSGQNKSGRVCREICTERNLLNAFGTFYEMPAENAGGFSKIRPIATHNRAIADYTSYLGMLVISGLDAATQGEHIIRSADGKAAVWVGNVEDLWQLGKPRGQGSVWKNTKIAANGASDAFLCTGFDQKRLVLSTEEPKAANFRLEADFQGDGDWTVVEKLTVEAAKPLPYAFPPSFGAYWIRLVSESDCTATATFYYE